MEGAKLLLLPWYPGAPTLTSPSRRSAGRARKCHPFVSPGTRLVAEEEECHEAAIGADRSLSADFVRLCLCVADTNPVVDAAWTGAAGSAAAPASITRSKKVRRAGIACSPQVDKATAPKAGALRKSYLRNPPVATGRSSGLDANDGSNTNTETVTPALRQQSHRPRLWSARPSRAPFLFLPTVLGFRSFSVENTCVLARPLAHLPCFTAGA